MAFDLTQTNFSGDTASFSSNGSAVFDFGVAFRQSYIYDSAGEHQANGRSVSNPGSNNATFGISYTTPAGQGARQIYVPQGYFTSTTSGNSNTYNQIFYTDTGGGFHAAAVSSNSYNPTTNSFQVVVTSGGNNTGFNTGSLAVSNGNGTPITATYSSQVTAGGNQILTYQLGGAPTTTGTYRVTLSTNVAGRGNDTAPTLNVNALPQPTPAPCYVTGTRIRVLRGYVMTDAPVERLRVGDLAVTASGKPRPIKWIGTRRYSGLTAPKHDRPVRVRAGALAENVPARDLLVSPDHCLWLDGLLVAAGHLVNGTSITRGEAVAGLTYWHVELDSHDILMAENTPAESFLAAPGVRAGFDGAVVSAIDKTSVPFAPRIEHGPELAALRNRLIARAGLSVEPVCYGSMRGWFDRCDGQRIVGWAQDLAHPNGRVCLDVVVNGTVIALTMAEQYRADIAAAGVGDGCHGFDLDLDEPLALGMAHTVELRRSADGERVCAMAVDATGAWTPLLAA